MSLTCRSHSGRMYRSRTGLEADCLADVGKAASLARVGNAGRAAISWARSWSRRSESNRGPHHYGARMSVKVPANTYKTRGAFICYYARTHGCKTKSSRRNNRRTASYRLMGSAARPSHPSSPGAIIGGENLDPSHRADARPTPGAAPPPAKAAVCVVGCSRACRLPRHGQRRSYGARQRAQTAHAGTWARGAAGAS